MMPAIVRHVGRHSNLGDTQLAVAHSVVDIAAAYRHIPVHPDIAQRLRYRIGDCTLADARAPMGAAGSASVMQTLLEAALHALRARHPSVLSFGYLDDVLLIGASRSILPAYRDLLDLLARLHLPPSLPKLQHPAYSAVFLGFRADMEISPAAGREVGYLAITPQRQEALLHHIRRADRHLRRKPWRRSLTCLRSLAGKLKHAASVFPGARGWVRNLFGLIALGDEDADSTRASPHRAHALRRNVLAELAAWRTALRRAHASGQRIPFPRPWTPPRLRRPTSS